MQAHYDIPGELFQGGQLYVISMVPESSYALMLGSLSLVGLALVRLVACPRKRLREMAGKV
jgi:hypothetical protein